MSVEITDVRVFRTSGSGKIKAYVNVTLGGEYTIHGVKVMERDDGALWVSMPRLRSPGSGVWRDIFHPITAEARERLIEAVLAAYEEAPGRGGENAGAEGSEEKGRAQ
jgi:stage V sporulation protein G